MTGQIAHNGVRASKSGRQGAPAHRLNQIPVSAWQCGHYGQVGPHICSQSSSSSLLILIIISSTQTAQIKSHLPQSYPSSLAKYQQHSPSITPTNYN